ncbi:hypothetical protein Tco_0028381 [Tanacetum coccineum]
MMVPLMLEYGSRAASRDGGSIDELLGLPKGWDDKFGLGDRSKNDAGKPVKQVGDAETTNPKSETEIEGEKKQSRKHRRKLRLQELKLAPTRRMAYNLDVPIKKKKDENKCTNGKFGKKGVVFTMVSTYTEHLLMEEYEKRFERPITKLSAFIHDEEVSALLEDVCN